MYLSPELMKVALQTSVVVAFGLSAVLTLVVRTVDRLNVRVAELEAEILRDRVRNFRDRQAAVRAAPDLHACRRQSPL